MGSDNNNAGKCLEEQEETGFQGATEADLGGSCSNVAPVEAASIPNLGLDETADSSRDIGREISKQEVRLEVLEIQEMLLTNGQGEEVNKGNGTNEESKEEVQSEMEQTLVANSHCGCGNGTTTEDSSLEEASREFILSGDNQLVSGIVARDEMNKSALLEVQPLPHMSRMPPETNPIRRTEARRFSSPGAYAVLQLRYPSNGNRRTTNRTVPNDAITPDAETGLVIANPVDGVSSLEIPRAEELENADGNTRKPFRNSKVLTFALVALIPLLIIVVVIATSQKPRSSTDTRQSPTVTPTAAPTQFTETSPLEQHILSLLPECTVKAIQDTDTAQAMAYEWLLQDPRLPYYAPWRIVQRYALATLYYATDGDHWFNNTDWLRHDLHECSWYSSTNGAGTLEKLGGGFVIAAEGVSTRVEGHILNGSACEGENDRNWDDPTVGGIKSLRLLENNLQGMLPLELYLLTTLKTLLLFENPLGGTISSHIANLTQLEIIYAPAAELSGTIPSEIGLLTKLNTLELFANSISGPIPTEVGLLGNLERLVLDQNNITSTIPTELAQLEVLHTLYLDTNALSGTLPTELGQLTSLYDLQVFGTDITGTIPTEIVSLSQLGKLKLQMNQLSGTIPTQVGLLQSVWYIDLWDNLLSGPIPTEVGQLSTLWFWETEKNQLTGTIPTEFGALGQNLTRLYVAMNDLTGEVPSELGLCTKLDELWLYENALHGDIFVDILQHLNKLTDLMIMDNLFTGNISSEVGLITNIIWFEVGSNSFTGQIPSDFGNLVNMRTLDLANNRFHGTIPTEVANLTLGALDDLHLQGNPLLSGTIPDKICAASSFAHSGMLFDCTVRLCGCECICTPLNETYLLANASHPANATGNQ